MKITFDTNTWQKVVVPERFPNDPEQPLMLEIRDAVRDGRAEGFISETVATLEAIRKGERASYLPKRAEAGLMFEIPHDGIPDSESGRPAIGSRVLLGGSSTAHPGLMPILADRLEAAFALGFKLIRVSRVATVRPTAIDHEHLYLPLTQQHLNDIWGHLDRLAEIGDAIEARGVGFSAIEAVARRIQQRKGLPGVPWYNGIDHPLDAAEEREIDRAFAEWADGDTVAAHIGYDLGIICTADEGKGARRSIFDASNREWLRQAYGLEILNMRQLAERLRSI